MGWRDDIILTIQNGTEIKTCIYLDALIGKVSKVLQEISEQSRHNDALVILLVGSTVLIL